MAFSSLPDQPPAAHSLTREALLQRITDASPALIAYVDTARRYGYCNRAYEEWLGMSREDVAGQPVADIVGADTYRAVLPYIDRALAGEASSQDAVTRHRDGTTRVLHTVLTPDHDEAGAVCGFFAFLTDVTAERRAEELRARSQKLEALGTLAGGIAHDFNNHLQAIRGFTDVVSGDIGANHTSQEFLREITQAAIRATDLVRRILAFSRPREPQVTPVQLRPVVEEAQRLLRSTLPARIELRATFADDLPLVAADPGQIHQILVNLATNAAHAIDSRGTIALRLESTRIDAADDQAGLRLGPYALLTVGDDGRGMDEETRERIFDPFFTTKAPGEGTGLGLSIVHGIMKSHGGAVVVQSEPGKGTAVRLYFPVASAAPAAPVDTGGLRAAPGRARILFVDDQAALARLAARTLGAMGHHAEAFISPTEALAALTARPDAFDLVITDLSMPEMSGIELAQAMLRVRPGLPIALTSGNLPPEEEAEARAAGIRELMLKPTSREEMAAVIGRLFETGGR